MSGARLAIDVLLLLAVYGAFRLAFDVKRSWRVHRVRSAFRDYQRSRQDIDTRYASSLLAMARPQVPPRWNEMVAAETARGAEPVRDTRGLN